MNTIASKTLQAVIFDMDGVLIDSESRHYPILRDMLAEYGYRFTVPHFVSYCGISEHEMWPQLLAEAGIQGDPAQFQQEHHRRYQADNEQRGWARFPGTEEFLQALRQAGFRLAVASGSSYDMIRDSLTHLGYLPYFDCVVSTQDCAHAKPEPDVFLLAAERLGVVPADCIVIEDSCNGMRAAQKAGMKWVGFSGAQLPSDLRLAPFSFSDYREISPEQLVQWFEHFPNVRGNKFPHTSHLPFR